MDRKVTTFLFAASLLWGGALKAAPHLNIQELRVDNYPHMHLIVGTVQAYPETVSETQNYFEIYESFGEREWKLDILDIQKIPEGRDALNLVFLIDSTESIKAQKAATLLIEAMQPGDQAALYSFNGKASLERYFTDKKDELTKAVQSIQRDGKVTRIYDALYQAIHTARATVVSPWPSKKSTPSSQTAAVLLFTDGQDEGSFLTEDDGIELSRLGERLSIPVYTILFGKSSRENTYSRLAIKTGQGHFALFLLSNSFQVGSGRKNKHVRGHGRRHRDLLGVRRHKGK